MTTREERFKAGVARKVTEAAAAAVPQELEPIIVKQPVHIQLVGVMPWGEIFPLHESIEKKQK